MSPKPHTTSSTRSSSRERRLAEYMADSSRLTADGSPVLSSQPLASPPIPISRRYTLHVTRYVSHVITYVLSTVACFVVLVFGYVYYTVQTVSVESLLRPDGKIQGIEELIGRSMIFTTSDQIEKLVLSRNPQLESVTIRKDLPQTLRLDPRYARAVVYIQINDHLYILLSQTGKVVQVVFDRPLLPELTYYQKMVSADYGLGMVLPYSDVRYACQLAHMLRSYGYTSYRLDIQDTSRIEVTQGPTTFLFSNKGAIKKQLQSFGQILEYLKRTQDTLKKVDFRFDRIITEK